MIPEENNWIGVVKYEDDGRTFVREQCTMRDAQAKVIEIMKEHGQERLVVWIAQIAWSIGK